MVITLDNQLRNTLADHLTQGINIIGIDRHDISMGMCVKIFYRQSLHTLKHLISKIAQGSLADINHQTVVGISTCHTNGIKTGHPAKLPLPEDENPESQLSEEA